MSVSDPRKPTLTQPALDALRALVALPFPTVIVPVRILQALLNDRDDWIDTTESLHKQLASTPTPEDKP